MSLYKKYLSFSGVTKARNMRQHANPSLFAGCVFSISPELDGPSVKSDVESMIKLGEGELVAFSNLVSIMKDPKHRQRLSQLPSTQLELRWLVLRGEDETEAEVLAKLPGSDDDKHAKIHVVPTSWLFNSISHYHLQRFNLGSEILCSSCDSESNR
jgi:hypothetical protein